MPKVTTHTARKDYEKEGIKKGDTYYKWSLRNSGSPRAGGTTFRSKTYPKPEQLTRNPWKLAVISIENSIAAADDPDALRAVAEEVQSLKDEVQGSLGNMPEALQQGDTGQMLQERIDALEELEGKIEEAASEWETKLTEACSECGGEGKEDADEEGEDGDEEEPADCSHCDGSGLEHDPEDLAEEAKDGLSIDV